MFPTGVTKLGLKTALGYIEKDPEKNLPKLMEWVDKLAGNGPDSFPAQRAHHEYHPRCGQRRAEDHL